MDTVQTKLTLPVVALHDTVVFPGMVLPLRIGRPASVKALESAYPNGGKVLLVAERERTENVDPDTLFRVGSLGQIAQLIRLPDGSYQALVQGISRVRI